MPKICQAEKVLMMEDDLAMAKSFIILMAYLLGMETFG
jgi:hypothetical protein